MEFMVGQQVIWTYKHSTRFRGRSGRVVLISAEVVQPGVHRCRIRIPQVDGIHEQRWVKPANLRLHSPGEPIYMYPEPV
jgi:hypothetical protein